MVFPEGTATMAAPVGMVGLSAASDGGGASAALGAGTSLACSRCPDSAV